VRYVLNITIPGISSNRDRTQYYIRHSPSFVKEIIAGIRCDPDNLAKMKDICEVLFHDAVMYNAVQSDTTFEIARESIGNSSVTIA